MTPEQIFTALAVPEGLPRDAMVTAGARREEMIPVFLDLIHRLQRADLATVAEDEGDSMKPTLLSGDAVLVDMTRRAPNPPGIFVLDDGMGLVAKRLEHIPNSDPPALRVISDNKHYP